MRLPTLVFAEFYQVEKGKIVNNLSRLVILGCITFFTVINLCGATKVSRKELNILLNKGKSVVIKDLISEYLNSTDNMTIQCFDSRRTLKRVLILLEGIKLKTVNFSNEELANISKAINCLEIKNLEKKQISIIRILANRIFGHEFEKINKTNYKFKVDEWQKLIPNDLSNKYLTSYKIFKQKEFASYSWGLDLKTDQHEKSVLSPNGQFIAVSHFWHYGSRKDHSESVTLFNTINGKAIYELKKMERTTEALAFSPSSKLLAIGSAQDSKEMMISNFHSINIVDTQTGKVIQTLKNGHRSQVRAAIFSPDEKILVTGSSGITVSSGPFINSVILWNVKTGSKLGTIDGNFNSGVHSFAFDPNGNKLAIATPSGITYLYDLRTFKLLFKLETKNDRLSTDAKIAFTQNGLGLITYSHGSAQLWNAETGTLLKNFTEVKGVAISTDLKKLAFITFNEDVDVWNLKTGENIRKITLEESDLEAGFGQYFDYVETEAIQFNTDGSKILIARKPFRMGEINFQLWDIEKNKAIYKQWKLTKQTFALISTDPSSFKISGRGEGGYPYLHTIFNYNEFTWEKALKILVEAR